jgi:hypothetical protein
MNDKYSCALMQNLKGVLNVLEGCDKEIAMQPALTESEI